MILIASPRQNGICLKQLVDGDLKNRESGEIIYSRGTTQMGMSTMVVVTRFGKCFSKISRWTTFRNDDDDKDGFHNPPNYGRKMTGGINVRWESIVQGDNKQRIPAIHLIYAEMSGAVFEDLTILGTDRQEVREWNSEYRKWHHWGKRGTKCHRSIFCDNFQFMTLWHSDFVTPFPLAIPLEIRKPLVPHCLKSIWSQQCRRRLTMMKGNKSPNESDASRRRSHLECN